MYLFSLEKELCKFTKNIPYTVVLDESEDHIKHFLTSVVALSQLFHNSRKCTGMESIKFFFMSNNGN